MFLRPKYKFLIRLRQNVWNTSKPLQFKKLKWKKVKRILFLNNRKKKVVNKTKNYFLNKFKMKNFFFLTLNTKKIILNNFGPLKKNQIFKLIKKSYRKGTFFKSYDIGFNKHTINNIKYDNLLYIMQSLESQLLSTFLRFSIFPNIFVYLYFIKYGYILVNNRTIRNPFFHLNSGDIISLDIKKLNKKSNLKNLGKLYKKYKCKSKHLVFLYKNSKIIFVKNPQFSDIEYLTTFHWDLILYLLKLKR